MKAIYTILVLLQAMVIQAQVKDIDGNVYKTIKIGSQIWMAENLATTRFKNGDYIVPIIENNQWSQWHLPAWTFYPYEKGPNPAGKLYNYYVIESPKGICPTGWHVPSDKEWNKLENYLGGRSIAGGKLKEEGSLFWQEKNEVSTLISGWNALPGGSRFHDGTFFGFGMLGSWWTSTEYGNQQAWSRFIYHFDKDITRNASLKTLGFSIRCIKNDDPVM